MMQEASAIQLAPLANNLSSQAQLVGLLYYCKLIPPPIETTNQIAEHSKENNRVHGITGMLMTSGEDSVTFQYVEGRKQNIIQLTENIQRDSRQEGFSVLMRGHIEERICPEWLMEICDQETYFEKLREISEKLDLSMKEYLIHDFYKARETRKNTM